MPTITHKYIFNGDFVDRGEKGVEVVSTILVLLLAMPGAAHTFTYALSFRYACGFTQLNLCFRVTQARYS